MPDSFSIPLFRRTFHHSVEWKFSGVMLLVFSFLLQMDPEKGLQGTKISAVYLFKAFSKLPRWGVVMFCCLSHSSSILFCLSVLEPQVDYSHCRSIQTLSKLFSLAPFFKHDWLYSSWWPQKHCCSLTADALSY
jgi:hypothetical protein